MPYCSNNIENKMGGECRMHGCDDESIQNCSRKTQRKAHLEDPGLYRRIILKWILRNKMIVRGQAQDSDRLF
jgi:hypothetical protein